MLSLFGILSWKAGGASEMAGQMLAVLKSSNLVPLFSVYFMLGYLMYAAFILAIGSVCNTIKEAQSYMGLFTMIMMVPLMTMMFIPKDPNGPLASVLSWIPLYTPFTMMNRANADPPLDRSGRHAGHVVGHHGSPGLVDVRQNLPHRHPAHRPAAQNSGDAAMGSAKGVTLAFAVSILKRPKLL